MDEDLEKKLADFLDRDASRRAQARGAKMAAVLILAVIGACSIVVWVAMVGGAMAGIR